MNSNHILKDGNSRHFQIPLKHHLAHLVGRGLVLIAFISALTATTSAQPRKLLGDDGALIWVEADIHELGIYAIEGGERTMLFFSAARAEDSRRLIYRQIYSLDGNRAFDHPQPINSPNMVASNGAGTLDADGNIYIGWFAAPPHDLTNVHLFVRKYDSNGRDLWDEGLVHRMEVDSGDGGDRSETPSSEYILPDGRGGCYHLSHFGIFAIGDDGQLREWEGQGEIPEELAEHGLYSPIADGAGGIWVSYYDFDLREDLWEHLRYDGSRLWGEFRRLQPEGIEGNPDVSIMVGWNGGGICEYNRNGICLIDGEGRLVSEDHQHRFDQGWRIRSGSRLLSDGSLLLFPEDSDRGDSIRTLTIRATKYRPDENDFPWDQDGIELGSWQAPVERSLSRSVISDPLETTDDNILIAISDSRYVDLRTIELTTVDQEGNNVERHTIQQNVNNGYSLNSLLAPAVDGGFWYYGARPYIPFHILTWYTRDGEPGLNEYIETFLPNRDGLWSPALWTDPEGNYRILTPQRDGFRRIVVSDQGEVTTPLEGERVTEMNWKYNGGLKSVQLGNSVFYLWLTDTNNLAKLASFDLDGNHEWTIDIEAGTNFDHDCFSLTVIPDERALLVGAVDRVTVDRVTGALTPYLFKVDAENGEIIWRWNQSSLRTNERHYNGIISRQIVYAEGCIYDSFHPEGYRLKLYKISNEGETLWRRPVSLRLEDVAVGCGMVSCSSGGVFLGLYTATADSSMAWLRRITTDCEVGDSLAFFAHYLPVRTRFDLSRGGENLWLVSRTAGNDSIGVVQGMREDGTRLLWANGYRPPMQEGKIARIKGGVTDGIGGFWLLYYYSSSSYIYGAPYTQWLPPDGDYPEDPVRPVDNPIMAGLNTYYIMYNGDLVTISNHATENFRHYHNTHAYRLQRVRHPWGLSSPKECPQLEEFSITAIYPNPFNSMTRITYSLPLASHVYLKLFDLPGREVMTKNEGNKQTGNHTITLNVTDLPSGLYFVRLNTDTKTMTQKVMLIK